MTKTIVSMIPTRCYIECQKVHCSINPDGKEETTRAQWVEESTGRNCQESNSDTSLVDNSLDHIWIIDMNHLGLGGWRVSTFHWIDYWLILWISENGGCRPVGVVYFPLAASLTPKNSSGSEIDEVISQPLGSDLQLFFFLAKEERKMDRNAFFAFTCALCFDVKDFFMHFVLYHFMRFEIFESFPFHSIACEGRTKEKMECDGYLSHQVAMMFWSLVVCAMSVLFVRSFVCLSLLLLLLLKRDSARKLWIRMH